MIQNFYSLITLLKHLNSVHAKSSIAGAFMLILILFSVSCSNTKDGKIESSVATFDECIYPRGAVIYRNYLIIVGENTVAESSSKGVRDSLKYSKKKKLFAIDLDNDKMNDSICSNISTSDLFNLFVRNDSLFGKFDSQKKDESYWQLWDGSKWSRCEIFPYETEFITSDLYKSSYKIFEDSLYFVYSCDQGEWGSGIIFICKKNNVVRGFPMRIPHQVFKDSLGYVVMGKDDIGFEIIRFRNPELLPVIHDSIIGYNDIEGLIQPSRMYLYNYFEQYIYEELYSSNSDYSHYKSVSKDQVGLFGYLLDSNNNISKRYKAEHMLISTRPPYLSMKGLMFLNDRYYCILETDSSVFVSEGKHVDSGDLANDYIFKTNLIGVRQFRKIDPNTYVILLSSTDWESPCHNFTCLIINDNFIKTYHFIPD